MWAALGTSNRDRSFFIFSSNYSFGNSNKLSLKCAVLQILSISQRPGPGREAQSQLPSPGSQTKKNKKTKKNTNRIYFPRKLIFFLVFLICFVFCFVVSFVFCFLFFCFFGLGARAGELALSLPPRPRSLRYGQYLKNFTLQG